MQCPLFVEFSRECQHEIGFLPLNTGSFCSTDKHKECPFYKAIYKIGYFCRYFKYCPAFDHFKIDNFEKFVSIVNEYCLSRENNKYCARFKLRMRNEMPSDNLLPDGSSLKK